MDVEYVAKEYSKLKDRRRVEQLLRQTLASRPRRFIVFVLVLWVALYASNGTGLHDVTALEEGDLTNMNLPSDGSKCATPRDLSKHTRVHKPVKHVYRSYWPQCFRFQCLTNEAQCDNTDQTNFNGPEPPCCIHILRDMAREFDRICCHLGLEYFPSYGMLLGLVRSDRLIPWTGDNDYMMEDKAMHALEDLWELTKSLTHGIELFRYHKALRFCVTPEFASGKLKRWKEKTDRKKRYGLRYPFTDIFSFTTSQSGRFITDQRKCVFNATQIRPSVRTKIYNNTMYQNFPREPEAAVANIFGPQWKTPDPDKSHSGNTFCAADGGAPKEQSMLSGVAKQISYLWREAD